MNSKNFQKWEVSKEYAGLRLDYFVKKEFDILTYPKICTLIRKGIIRVNNKRTKNNFVLSQGDVIFLTRNFILKKEQKTNPVDEKYVRKLKSWIIFKDEDVILLNKPSGLAVQGGTNVKINLDHILDSLRFNSNDRPRLVHRLDKQTSGILILARTLKAAKFFGNIFKKRQIEKKYLAIVDGNKLYKNGIINFDLENKEKNLKAETHYKVIYRKYNYSLLLIKILTGRKHQIRQHLSMINHSILGETKYVKAKEKKSSFLYLHAYKIKYQNQDGKNKHFYADIPNHFDNKLKELGLDFGNFKFNEDFGDLNKFKILDLHNV